MTRVFAAVPRFNEPIERTIESIKGQTHEVSAIGVVSATESMPEGIDIAVIQSPNLGECVGKRVAKALNLLLQNVTLSNYEYVLRVDSDVTLPPDFLESSLRAGADIVGKAGYAMLIRVEPFLQHFGGRFPEVCAEDSYLMLDFMSRGLRVVEWNVKPLLSRRSGAGQKWRYFYDRGVEMHRLGYEPLHVLETVRRDIRNWYCVLGYLYAKFTSDRQYPFAKWVWRRQLRRLIGLK